MVVMSLTTMLGSRFESIVPLFSKPMFDKVWSAWQKAQGAIRIFAKITTQCRPSPNEELPSDIKNPSVWYKQRTSYKYWGQCEMASTEKWDVDWWPSAVVGCARFDEQQDIHDNNLDAYYASYEAFQNGLIDLRFSCSEPNT